MLKSASGNFKAMYKEERIPYDQFTGQFIHYSEPKKIEGYPDSNYLYMMQNYYGQGAALMTMNGYHSWNTHVRKHISQQGLKSNVLRYQRPDLRQFAAQIGKKDCLLLKEHNGKFVPEDAKVPEMNENMVDMRFYSDWLKAGNLSFSVVNEEEGSILGTNGNDYTLYQDGTGYRVSNRVGNMWKVAQLEWWNNGQGKIVERLSLKDFLKKASKQYKGQVKELYMSMLDV